MSDPSQSMFSQIDVTNLMSQSSAPPKDNSSQGRDNSEIISLLQKMLVQQERQNDLLTRLINMQTSPVRQRAEELRIWRAQHPDLSRGCRKLLTSLSESQVEYFTRMVETSAENAESWEDSEYLVGDFIDRFGPRLMHLNGILQALSQLAAPPEGLE